MNKSKEELISELFELQQAHKALQASAAADMVTQKQTMEALRESEARFQLLFNKAPLGYQSLDFDGNFLEVNQQWLDTLGYERQEVIGKWFGDFLTPAFQDGFRKRFPIFKELGKIHSEFEMIHKNGSVLFIAFDGRIGYDDKGDFKQTHCILKDITEIKHAEKALIESEEKYRLLHENAGIGIGYYKVDGTIISFNNIAAKNMNGVPEDFEGKSLYDFFPKSVADSYYERMKKAAVSEIPVSYEDEVILTAGSKYFLSTYARISNANGEIEGIQVLSHDITDRRQVEAALKESEEKYRLLYDSMNQGLALHEIITDENGKPVDYWFLDINDSYTRLLGVTREMSIGKRIREVMPKVEQYWIDIFGKVALTGESSYYENYLETTGKYYSTYSYCPKKNQFAVLVNDITERKQNEEKLIKSEERYALVVEASEQGIWDWNVETNEVFYSEHWKKQIGYDDHELKNEFNTWVEHLHPDEMEYCQNAVLSYLNQPEKHFVLEFRFRHKDGTYRWIHNKAASIKNEEGKVIRLFGTHTDITERIQAAEKLRQSEAIKNTMVSNIGDVIVIIDQNGINQYKSPNITTLFGWKPEELVGKSTWENVHPDDLNAAQEFIATLAKEPYATETTEIRYKRKDGRYVWIEITIVNLLSDPNIRGFLGNYHDISSRKKAEQELIIAKNHAEESDRLKSAFLANMSHEIRTPMNGILGFAELLKEPNLTGEQQQEYVKIIEKSGDRMLNIINNIMDISKIEANLMNVDRKECNINEKIEFIYTFFKPQVEEKGMLLHFKTTLPAKEATIRTDNEKVYSILTNLVKNAIKFSVGGTIEFGYIKKNEMLEFFVKDTGIGIPKDRQSVIFERFIQADISDKMARQGAGLGLSISKAYVELLGGKIWVESEEGIGTTFYFTLPYNAFPDEKVRIEKDVHPQTNVEQKNSEFSGLKILIAEDDETSEMLISIDVSKFSKTILIAKTGIEAVDECRNNPDIDLILMDIQMPVMNGYEATRQIRLFNSDVIIIAQTAFGIYGDREKAIEAGCNDYITKPINKAELLSLIHQYFKI